MCDISLILHDANYQKLLATTSHRNIKVKNYEKGIQILSESLGCVYWISFIFSITKAIRPLSYDASDKKAIFQALKLVKDEAMGRLGKADPNILVKKIIVS